MRFPCCKCGKELVVKYGFRAKDCYLLAFEAAVECKDCGNKQKIPRMLDGEGNANISSGDKSFFDKVGRENKRYIG